MDVQIDLAMPTMTSPDQSSETAPIQTFPVTLRFTVPAEAEGEKINEAAYGYGQMVATQAAGVLGNALRAHNG